MSKNRSTTNNGLKASHERRVTRETEATKETAAPPARDDIERPNATEAEDGTGGTAGATATGQGSSAGEGGERRFAAETERAIVSNTVFAKAVATAAVIAAAQDGTASVAIPVPAPATPPVQVDGRATAREGDAGGTPAGPDATETGNSSQRNTPTATVGPVTGGIPQATASSDDDTFDMWWIDVGQATYYAQVGASYVDTRADVENGPDFARKFDGVYRNVIGTVSNDVIEEVEGVNRDNSFSGGKGNDTLMGRGGNDTLDGGKGNDILDGGIGNDRLIGGEGGDRIDGGEGSDTIDYSGSTGGVFVDLEADGNGFSHGRGGDAEGDTFRNVENVVGSDHDDKIRGNSADNVLSGGKGNDLIDGGRGNDVVEGGEGDDSLSGGAGDDVLKGGAGADTLVGDDGIDTADYSESDAGVRIDLQPTDPGNPESWPGGHGEGGHAQGDRLKWVENVVGSNFADVIHGERGEVDNGFWGGAGDDQLFGHGGNDVLSGGAGADVIDGGAGVDTVDYSTSHAGVNIRLDSDDNLGGDAEGDKLIDVENVIGSDHHDMIFAQFDEVDNRLSGGRGNDMLFGYGGNDVLSGGEGADAINGGTGVDTADYATSKAGVRVDLAQGKASGGDAEGDTLTWVENLTGSAHADHLTGDAGANRLDGGAGNDVLVGGAGADVLIGGDGIDTADYSASVDGVRINLGLGTGEGGDAQDDTLQGIEHLILSNSHDFVFGTDEGNRIEGLAGNDEIYGLAGNDYVDGGSGADYIDGGIGDDTVFGGEGYDRLLGGEGNDRLLGDAGNDRIDGGAGWDDLWGGAGDDSFVFRETWGDDYINDFAEEDVIELDAAAFAELDDVLANAVQNDSGVVLTFQGGTITLFNTTLDQITADDFRNAA